MKMTLEEKKTRESLLKKRHWITERQLQGLVKYEIKHTRECLAFAVRRQELENNPLPDGKALTENGQPLAKRLEKGDT